MHSQPYFWYKYTHAQHQLPPNSSYTLLDTLRDLALPSFWIIVKNTVGIQSPIRRLFPRCFYSVSIRYSWLRLSNMIVSARWWFWMLHFESSIFFGSWAKVRNGRFMTSWSRFCGSGVGKRAISAYGLFAMGRTTRKPSSLSRSPLLAVITRKPILQSRNPSQRGQNQKSSCWFFNLNKNIVVSKFSCISNCFHHFFGIK